MSGVGELEGPVTALEQAFDGNADLATAAREGSAATRKVLARLDLRNEVIETGKPASQEKIQDILSPTPPEEQGPPPAFNIDVGDALTVLGDNFVVDGKIDLQAGGQGLRLLRVGTSPERWLAVPAERGRSFALLETSDQPHTGGTESTIGGAAYTIQLVGRWNWRRDRQGRFNRPATRHGHGIDRDERCLRPRRRRRLGQRAAGPRRQGGPSGRRRDLRSDGEGTIAAVR